MNAILKSENKILINGADSSEKILVQSLVERAANSDITFESVLDINGEITGCMITLSDKEPNSEPTENSEETAENSEENNSEENEQQ